MEKTFVVEALLRGRHLKIDQCRDAEFNRIAFPGRGAHQKVARYAGSGIAGAHRGGKGRKRILEYSPEQQQFFRRINSVPISRHISLQRITNRFETGGRGELLPRLIKASG
jgi:hypothetical protein